MARRITRRTLSVATLGAIVLVAAACAPPVTQPTTVSVVIKAKDPLLSGEVLPESGNANPVDLQLNQTLADTVTDIPVGVDDFQIEVGRSSGNCDQALGSSTTTGAQGFEYVADFERTVNVTTNGQVLQLPAAKAPVNNATITGTTAGLPNTSVILLGFPLFGAEGTPAVVACTTAVAGAFTLHAVPAGYQYQAFYFLPNQLPAERGLLLTPGANVIVLP
jgi:hypothetical protein